MNSRLEKECEAVAIGALGGFIVAVLTLYMTFIVQGIPRIDYIVIAFCLGFVPSWLWWRKKDDYRFLL